VMHDRAGKRSEIGTKCRKRIRYNEHRRAESDRPFSRQPQMTAEKSGSISLKLFGSCGASV
jgi:hypothetical protein